jgi:2-polyprenyl-3-methyl-5-hydroxy-6-metoxy-1,4-benzoquinol methylase
MYSNRPGADHREERIKQSWKANATAWTDVVREGRIESRRLATDEAIVSAVLRYGARRVLDVGCGEAWLARALAGHGLEVTGVDGSAELIEQARALGEGRFEVITYEQIVAAPERLAGPYEGIVCNFALLGETITPLLLALRPRLAEDGRLFVQTVHPFTACGDEPYVDGWRTETFANFGARFREPMPWYFRTMGSWLRAIHEAELRVGECLEPVHPFTGRPLSLLLVCEPGG